MSTYQKILTGIRAQDTDLRVVETAALIAAETGARLILVTARVEPSPHTAEQLTIRPTAEASPAEQLLRRADAHALAIGASATETHALEGDTAGVLVSAAHDTGAGLLVIGTDELSTIGMRVLGSASAGIVREVDCDVLVAHTSIERWARVMNRHGSSGDSRYPRTVVVGVHDTEQSRRAAAKATAIARDTDAQLVLAGALEPTRHQHLIPTSASRQDHEPEAHGIEDGLRDAEAQARTCGVSRTRKLLIKGDPMNGLIKVADTTDADLLVLGNRQLTSAASRLLGSISLHVLRKTPCHVLLVQ